MLGRWIAFVLCLVGMLLPCRLRVLYGEFLGWITQLVYFTYYGIMNHILTELRKAELERRGG